MTVAGYGLLLRVVVPVFLGLAVLHTLVSILQFVLGSDLRDLIPFLAAAKQVAVNGWADLYDLSVQEQFQRPLIAGIGRPEVQSNGFYYPPSVALLFLPLAQLPASLVLMVWLTVNTALAALTGVLAARSAAAVTAGDQGGQACSAAAPHPSGALPVADWRDNRVVGRSSRSSLVVWALLPFALLPVVWGLIVAQPVGLFAALYALAFLALLRRADATAGLCLGLLTLVKPHLALGAVLLLVVQRRVRALAVVALCISALAGFSLLAVGLDGVRDYLQLFSHVNTFHGSEEMSLRPWYMVNWRSWLTKVPGLDDAAGELLTAAAGLATLAGVAYAWRRPVADAPTLAAAFLGFTAAGLLSNYQSHYQDLATLLAPAAAVVAWAWRTRGAPLYRAAAGQGVGRVVRAWGRSGRDREVAGMAAAAALLLAGVPGLAWLLFGIRALGQISVWAALGAPGLLLVILLTLRWSASWAQSPQREASGSAKPADCGPQEAARPAR